MAGFKLADVFRNPLCSECGHEVRQHQPSGSHQPRGHAMTMVGCLLCGCQLTMNAKLRAWGGRRK